MNDTAPLALAAGIVTLALGAVLTHRTYRAARRTDSASLLALAAGFALVTAGVAAGSLQWLAASDGLPVGVALGALGVVAFAYALVVGDEPTEGDQQTDGSQ